MSGASWRATIRLVRRTWNKMPPQREVVVHARSAVTAQKAVDLAVSMHAFLTTALDCPLFDVWEIGREPSPRTDSYLDGVSSAASSRFSSGHVLDSFGLAARASRRRDYAYSAQLLFQSYQLFCTDSMRYFHGPDFAKPHRSSLPKWHVRFAYAIIAAYAAIEQLGLEVRAKKKGNAYVARTEGTWHPPALDCLRLRLEANGLRHDEQVIWLERLPRSRIQHRFQSQHSKQPTEWTSGIWQDHTVELCDAIDLVRSLRSRVASHRVQDWVKMLSRVDVSNAQMVAWHLLWHCLNQGKEICRY